MGTKKKCLKCTPRNTGCTVKVNFCQVHRFMHLRVIGCRFFWAKMAQVCSQVGKIYRFEGATSGVSLFHHGGSVFSTAASQHQGSGFDPAFVLPVPDGHSCRCRWRVRWEKHYANTIPFPWLRVNHYLIWLFNFCTTTLMNQFFITSSRQIIVGQTIRNIRASGSEER